MRIALGVEYCGSRYSGWQRQSHSTSVQACVETSVSTVANEPIQIYCAGRTDTGVHATGQVVHFDTNNERPLKAWTMGGNAHLPDDISIRWACQVPEDFHARFSAVARRYRYVIVNSRSRPAVLHQGLTWSHKPLNAELMAEATPFFLGERDFSSFQAASCQSPTPFRNIRQLSVTRIGEFIVVDITANAFLHHMVRNIVGALMVVGRGEKPPPWIAEVIDNKDRTLAPPTASPKGLYLVDVTYPKRFSLPRQPLGPIFLDDLL